MGHRDVQVPEEPLQVTGRSRSGDEEHYLLHEVSIVCVSKYFHIFDLCFVLVIMS